MVAARADQWATEIVIPSEGSREVVAFWREPGVQGLLSPAQTQGGWYNQEIVRACGVYAVPTGILDINPAAEQVQLALLHQAGMARRIDLAAELTSFALEGTYTALRRCYPEASVLETHLLFVEQQYGLATTNHLRAALMPSADDQDQ